jgi:hypothetical protein
MTRATKRASDILIDLVAHVRPGACPHLGFVSFRLDLLLVVLFECSDIPARLMDLSVAIVTRS